MIHSKIALRTKTADHTNVEDLLNLAGSRLFSDIRKSARVQWGSVTRVLRNRPKTWEEVRDHLIPMTQAPEAHDVMIARVKEINRHTRIELDSGRKAQFFVGDLLGLAFGFRYATRQFLGEVPGLQSTYHMLSQGGVCGQVISAPTKFSEPTVLEPLGYLRDANNSVLNLRQLGISPPAQKRRVRTILAIGSSMDAGKTTMAASIIHGLTKAGNLVHAGKVTGTACVKDLNQMEDAGSVRTIDFTHAGFASTSQASSEELHVLCDTVFGHLAEGDPDYVVIEIADGLVQRETRMVLDYLSSKQMVDHVCLAVHDAMAGPTCVDLLREEWGFKVAAVSGVATASALSTEELQSQFETPCWTAEALANSSVQRLFKSGRHESVENALTDSRV